MGTEHKEVYFRTEKQGFTFLVMDITDKKISLQGIKLLLGKEIKSFKRDIIFKN